MEITRREHIIPTPGHIYRNQGGGEYRCIRGLPEAGDAVMRNIASGWTLHAHDCGIYQDGTIDWSYSTNGHFTTEELE